jgi:hypothetical protein
MVMKFWFLALGVIVQAQSPRPSASPAISRTGSAVVSATATATQPPARSTNSAQATSRPPSSAYPTPKSNAIGNELSGLVLLGIMVF